VKRIIGIVALAVFVIGGAIGYTVQGPTGEDRISVCATALQGAGTAFPKECKGLDQQQLSTAIGRAAQAAIPAAVEKAVESDCSDGRCDGVTSSATP
jgi:hypothetical protein